MHGVILAGGPSDNPLARYRAMPAVELGESHLTGALQNACIKYIWHAALSSSALQWLPQTGHSLCILLTWVPHLLSAGSNTQLVDVSISNCIRSGINKM